MQTQKTKKKVIKKINPPKEDVVFTKEDFFKTFDKAIQPVKKPQPASKKRKISE